VTIVTAAVAAAKKAAANSQAIAEGVFIARNLVNEPANVLGPVEFAAKAKELEKLGVEVEILTEREMKKLGMGALLGVAQGSVRPPRLAVMQWKGGKPKTGRSLSSARGSSSIRAAFRSRPAPAWRI
jgi:leucyl aminopeptidase